MFEYLEAIGSALDGLRRELWAESSSRATFKPPGVARLSRLCGRGTSLDGLITHASGHSNRK
jgi:hypothetical protein